MPGIVSQPRPMLNAAYYKRRAQEIRVLRARVADPWIRKQLDDIAEGYDRIAERVKAWDRDHPQVQSCERIAPSLT